MLKRSLAAAALAVTLAAPAAHAQTASTPGNHTPPPPVRLWYRLVVTADLIKQGDFALSGVQRDADAVAGALQPALAAPVQAASPPPKRLWYRIEASADAAKFGDFEFPTYTDQRSTHMKVHLRSHAAVLLYRQCTALGIDRFDPSSPRG